MKRKTLSLGILFLCLALSLGEGHAAPLSDLGTEEFERGPAALSPMPRSPFVPTYRPAEDVDVNTLLVQGILHGRKVRMALLSGMIIREGERIGKYRLDNVKSDAVVLSQESSLYRLKLENYVAPNTPVERGGFSVEFRNASLRDALRLLAKGAGLNILMPEDLGGRVTLSFHNIHPLEALRSVLRVNGFEYAMEEGIVRVGRPEAFAGGTDLRTENFHLKYATAKDLVEKVKLLLSDRGAVIADERTNMLTVKDRDALVANIASLVSQIDRRDEQVQIEARIVDASKSFSRALGIRWGLSGQKGNVQFGGTSSVGTNADTTNVLNVNLGAENPTSGLGLIIGQIAGFLDIESQLTAAEQKGEIAILSRPSVTTVNNAPAKIRSGTKIYVKSTSSISIGSAPGVSSGAGTSALQEIDTGIELIVTPQISPDGFIKLKIEATESEADFSRTVDGIPAVLDNTATTTVLVKDGETAVIGGLFRVKTTKEKKGVPGLQGIPVMGYLFQSRTKTKEDSELMIFITPKVIK